DGDLAGAARSVVGGGSGKGIAVDGKLAGTSQSLRDANVIDRDKDGGGSGYPSGLGDGVSKLVKERMIPVLGRTAAGIIHCWDQCGTPDSWQAETKLAELVKKHIGKDIVGSNSGEVEVDSDAAKLAGSLAGRFDTNAYVVQVSADDEGIVEFVGCCDIAKRYPDCFGLRIDGDSMRPRICDGDIVILSPSVPAKQGAIVVAKVRDQIGVTCKIIRFDGEQVHLVAGNENYETRVVERGQLIWALAVLGHVRQRQV
ncbi:MAG: S24 family peptidase, partial [Planctomycetes bacterium]|nr:S24 family peptidase [Planctomycetota bacterium]